MACPICVHTMENIGVNNVSSTPVFWCPRCGTLKENGTATPTLVRQCRTLLDQYKHDQRIVDILRTFSITESVTKEPS